MRRNSTAFKQRFQSYKDGKPISEIYDAGYIKEPVITPDKLYNEYINSLPDNLRLTPESSYRSHRYWELNGKPKNFSLAIQKGMFTMQPDGWHANSVAENINTGELEFMKPWNHPTVKKEYDWFKSEEASDFRKRYKLVGTVPYDKYIPKYKDGKMPYKNGLPKYEDGKEGNKINTAPAGGVHLDEIELYLVDNSELSAADKIVTGISSGIMGFAREFGAGVNNELDYVRTRRELGGGTAQRTYLLPRSIQKRVFIDDGYIEGTPGDYGLVKSAVGNRNLPVYQTRRDAVPRKNLVHLGNILDGGYDTTFIDPERQLVHAGSFPSAIYVDGSTGLLYQKAWDLNDYGGNHAGVTYDGKQWLANILDSVGSPTVVTTGYLPMNNMNNLDMYLGDYFSEYKGDWRDDLLQRIINQGLAKKGLHLEEVNGKRVPMLPGIEVIYDKNTKEYHYYKDGKLPGYKDGKIHIKPANRGKFTALKKRTGHSASWFKENGTPAQKKMAVFALNAKKWKH